MVPQVDELKVKGGDCLIVGASQLHPIFLALNKLLRSKNLKIKRSILERFLEKCDADAP